MEIAHQHLRDTVVKIRSHIAQLHELGESIVRHRVLHLLKQPKRHLSRAEGGARSLLCSRRLCGRTG